MFFPIKKELTKSITANSSYLGFLTLPIPRMRSAHVHFIMFYFFSHCYTGNSSYSPQVIIVLTHTQKFIYFSFKKLLLVMSIYRKSIKIDLP